MKVKEHIDLLGLEVEDKVTGFKGIVSSVSFDLYGCLQVVITPKIKEDGNPIQGAWFDAIRLNILNHNPVMKRPDFEFDDTTKKQHVPGPAEKPMKY